VVRLSSPWWPCWPSMAAKEMASVCPPQDAPDQPMPRGCARPPPCPALPCLALPCLALPCLPPTCPRRALPSVLRSDQTLPLMAASWSWAPDSKLCFVTTGATAPFTDLIAAALSPACLDALISDGFTHLLVQYGSAKDVFTSSLSTAQSHLRTVKSGLIVDGIDFDSDGLVSQFTLVQQSKGLVISHAGTSRPFSCTVTPH
jgi:hypothetical protein